MNHGSVKDFESMWCGQYCCYVCVVICLLTALGSLLGMWCKVLSSLGFRLHCFSIVTAWVLLSTSIVAPVSLCLLWHTNTWRMLPGPLCIVIPLMFVDIFSCSPRYLPCVQLGLHVFYLFGISPVPLILSGSLPLNLICLICIPL